MSNRIPPLLEPYLTLSRESSLILLTSVLGASTNWLVLRYIYAALHPLASLVTDGINDEGQAEANVVLVSFMRDLAFWKDGGRRLGLDLEKLALQKRFSFIDGLTRLYSPAQKQKNDQRPSLHKTLQSPAVSIVSEEIKDTLADLKGVRDGELKTVLIIDQLDLLLATGGDGLGAVALQEMIMALRQQVFTTVMTLSADAPLVFEDRTPLESRHAAFLLNITHQADLVTNLRLLDSGTARDVSGVVRITPRDQGVGLEGSEGAKELLYFVGGDGSVKVFERGQ